MKRFFSVLFSGLLLCLSTGFGQTQDNGRPIWKEISKASISDAGERLILPKSYRVFELNVNEIRDSLASTPMEFSESARTAGIIISLPFPDGSFKYFRIAESPIMAPELRSRHPELRTYSGRGIDDKSATCRISVTPKGFHALIFSAQGTVYIDPYSSGTPNISISYFSTDFIRNERLEEKPDCMLETGGNPVFQKQLQSSSAQTQIPSSHGTKLRTYRIAVGGWQYVIHYNGKSWKWYEELWDLPSHPQYSVSVTENSVFIAGDKNGRATILHGIRKK